MKRRFFGLATIYCLVLSSAWAQTAQPAQTGSQPAVVKVTGEVLTPLTLTAADLAAMPRTTAVAKDKQGVPHTFSGVALSDIFNKAGVTTGPQLRGKNLAKYLLVSCADGYQVVFSLAELDSSFTDRVVILADQIEGRPLPAGVGPFQLIVPGEKKPARDCREVTGLTITVTNSFGAQELHSRWDELTASDWPKALDRSGRTCILPIGILEKHGPHVPIGSDLIQVREWAARATKKEYAVVFPDYFYGQINEARHQPGTFALPERVVWDLLEATCDEIARNGFNKIVIINGHGGNPELIRYFIQTRLEKRRDYAVYFFEPANDSTYARQLGALHQSDPAGDQHAGERETSSLLYLRPDLVEMDSASNESGANQHRLKIPNVYTAIWWYAAYPNHYAGDGAKATRAEGQLVNEHYIGQLVEALRAIKADTKTMELQKEFFDRVKEK